MGEVTSRDGTRIVYDRAGDGPPLILVSGALCDRHYQTPLAERLAADFTVYNHDRRGRGESTAPAPVSREAEVEDIAALVREAGGTAFVYGISSGGGLALEAAAAGVGVAKVAAYEPPYNPDDAAMVRDTLAYHAELTRILAEGRDWDAVALFMKGVGMPDHAIEGMRSPAMERMGPALAHDSAVMGDAEGGRVPAGRFAVIGVPALVLTGSETYPFMHAAAREIAEAVKGAEHRVLEGQTHQVDFDVLAPVLRDFFRA
ncbi:alpha/beta fold hydrolase [Bailinhaonella thermotolerans]|uniref:Alpha/beta hydrolase n=1 Tax=Bailinhaonella thermotolerans TaxID=1070861 RepID=A0A3A4A7X0_9ACTN|nr:alpha/beta fold hydrolase [Bailinhaonella thermotolerans]RJL25116.1 alpha/beta hydrolase [Bailinhaonella thermotolerans]